MRILVTGGTGVVGETAISRLVELGHDIVLFSRNAERDVKQWPERVEARPGDIGDAATVRGAAKGCAAVVHIVGIVAESPPEITFERINVRGTQNIVDEARRSGVHRFVYLSSLGADKGESDYHRSKRRGEDIVRSFDGNWTILRAGNVYGPGDEVISLLLKAVRTLPAIPVIDTGDHPFQPIWTVDLADAIAEAVQRKDLATRILELAGVEVTTMNDMLDRFAAITGKNPLRIPVPSVVADIGTRAAGLFGVEVPVGPDQIRMMIEGNVLMDQSRNGLIDPLGVLPTPLDFGLRVLADALPEQSPTEGVGRLKRKRFWADIAGSPLSAEGLFEVFRSNFGELTAASLQVGVEPGTNAEIDLGATLTMAIPVRGNVQVRVEEITERGMTLCTLAGHPLAGAVRFLSEERGDLLRFEIQVYDRPATVIDWVMMNPVGDSMQSQAWVETIERVVSASGGLSVNDIETESTALDDQKSGEIANWVDDLVATRKREQRRADAEEREERAPM
jgi:NADH dehydrogenase